MPSPLQLCPHCGTRVLPTGDDKCPACGRGMADPPQPRPTESRRTGSMTVYEAAVMHWRLIALVIAQLVAGAYLVYARRSAPGTESLNLLALAVIANAFVIAWHVHSLARWLGYTVPALWAIAVFIPIVGLVVIVLLIKSSVTIFEKLGYPTQALGPRLRDLPRDPA